MSKIVQLDLDSDDGNADFTINKNYADRYEKWRSAEVMQQLKAKHGNNPNDVEEDESSSESEADWTPSDERDFLRTLGALKSKDPKIYNKEKRFFAKKDVQNDEEQDQPMSDEKKSKKKAKGMSLRDYEVALVERGGKFDDEDDAPAPEENEGYFERNQRLKDEFKKALNDNSDEDDGLFKKKIKTKEQKQKDDDDYAEWLKGEGKALAAPDEDIKSLKKVWTQPEISNDDAFLRDYLLNKEYEVDSDEDTKAAIEEMDNIEDQLEKAEDFEHKYNFRFEDPDQDFIKQYPRTIKESVRKGNEKRKDDREERKKRKEEEKKQQQEEVKLLKSLKKKQIEQKLKKLRAIAGNEGLPVTVDDLEKEFDPKEYDQRMNELFASEYYDDGTEDVEKPVFSDLSDDEDSDYDNMETRGGGDDDEEEKEEVVETRSKGETGRKRKRNSKFNSVIQKSKPLFDPEEKSFEDYFNEYYSLDYEDILADGMRTKFKYRNVMANDFGLTADEILSLDDRQLNKWASVKKVSQYRTDREEEFDKNVYEKKAANPNSKARIFAKKDVLDETTETVNQQPVAQPGSKSSVKKAKKQAAKEYASYSQAQTYDDANDSKKKNRRKKKANNFNKPENAVNGVSVDRLKAYDVSNKAIKRKIHGGQKDNVKKFKQ